MAGFAKPGKTGWTFRPAVRLKMEVRETGTKEKRMPLVQEPYFDSRLRQIRGSGRMNSRVAVAVEWKEDGQEGRAEGFTVDIGAKGCLAVVPQNFGVGQKLRLVNLSNQLICEAILIWRGHENRQGWELGLELLDPSADFWGLDF